MYRVPEGLAAAGLYWYGSTGSITPTKFRRTIRIELPTGVPDTAIVYSTVSWDRNGVIFSVQDQKNIFNWFQS
jgi:hypothetical protein